MLSAGLARSPAGAGSAAGRVCPADAPHRLGGKPLPPIQQRL